MDYYRVLGIDPKLQLNLNELQQLFYGRSRELHPDRFARAEASVREAALNESSLLNDAYRALKDPVQRAEYFLKNRGFDIGEQGTKDVPPQLLEEVFELNMALEELKSGDDSARPQLATARDQFAALLAQSDVELGQLFEAHDGQPGEAVLKQIRGLLNRRRYIQNLLRDVHGYLSN
ncbi:MAG: Fe-S protein assembly co-chaperone HscB [Acidobacteria bacterium]|nr:Fe-S protein assembly co-chaperone HscB [Acidobacteriota bacterium]